MDSQEYELALRKQNINLVFKQARYMAAVIFVIFEIAQDFEWTRGIANYLSDNIFLRKK